MTLRSLTKPDAYLWETVLGPQKIISCFQYSSQMSRMRECPFHWTHPIIITSGRALYGQTIASWTSLCHSPVGPLCIYASLAVHWLRYAALDILPLPSFGTVSRLVFHVRYRSVTSCLYPAIYDPEVHSFTALVCTSLRHRLAMISTVGGERRRRKMSTTLSA